MPHAEMRLNLNPEYPECQRVLGLGQEVRLTREENPGKKILVERQGGGREVRTIHWCLEITNARRCHKAMENLERFKITGHIFIFIFLEFI